MPEKINLDSVHFKNLKQSSKYVCLVLVSSFSAIEDGVHSQRVIATSSSLKTVRAGCIASAQMWELSHNEKSESAECHQVIFSDERDNEFPSKSLEVCNP